MRFIFVLLTTVMAFPALSAWQLDNQNSRLSFVTIKKSHVAEVSKFEQLKGSVDNSGKVAFNIELASVNTNIGIRDDRMKEHLFNTKLFPSATFTSQLDMAAFKKIAVGKTAILPLSGSIGLHGQNQQVNVDVLVAKLTKNSFVVSSLQPVVIKASGFDLVKGINKLKELAGLPSISNVVPVSFVLTFNQ